MTARALWRWCAAAGVAAFACLWGFGRIAGLVACGPTGGLGPIIAFELARSPADVLALFGVAPCTAPFAAAQRTGLLLDGLGFIPCYTAFLILGAVAAGARGRIRAGMIAILATAGFADEIEGYILGRILDHLPGSAEQIDTLYWVVHVKFALLAAGTLAIGALLVCTRRPTAILPGVVIGASGLIALKGFAQLPDPGMMTGFAVAWIILLTTALTGSWWPALFSPSPARVVPPQGPAAPSA